MKLDFEGFDEALKNIDRIEGLTESLKDDALIKGGDLLRDKVESEVYLHGLTERSGDAGESIVRTKPKNGTVYVGTEGGKKKKGFYLYMHEVGYYNVNAGKFIAPKPFMSVVYENQKKNILNAYAGVFRRGLGM